MKTFFDMVVEEFIDNNVVVSEMKINKEEKSFSSVVSEIGDFYVEVYVDDDGVIYENVKDESGWFMNNYFKGIEEYVKWLRGE